MILIEFTRYTGSKVSINPDYIAYVSPAERGTNIFVMGGSVHTVSESYTDVIRLIESNGNYLTARATAGI